MQIYKYTMPKRQCKICLANRKVGKFFKNGSNNCNKCMTKHKSLTNNLIKSLNDKEPLSSDEKKKLSLSIETSKELKEKIKESKEFEKAITDIKGVTNPQDIYDYLEEYELTKRALKEISNHFATVYQVSNRSRAKANDAAKAKAAKQTSLNQTKK